MSSNDLSHRGNMPSREDWDHLAPDSLNNNDEVAVAGDTGLRHRRRQERLGATQPSSLQHNDPLPTTGANSHGVRYTDVSPRVSPRVDKRLENAMSATITSPATSPSAYRSQDSSQQHEDDLPANRRREPLPRSINSSTTRTEGPRMVVAIDYGTTYTGR